MKPLFGINVDPLYAEPDKAARLAMIADAAGLDLVAVQDHPYQRAFLDTWTLLATLVPRTQRISFVPDVACLPLRPPAMLAKAAASLDVLSGGRLEIGLGAGAFWDPIAGMGGPRRTPGEAFEALEEAIAIMRLLWSDERSVSFDGRHYSIAGARPTKPAHAMGIWLGAIGPRMLGLVGRAADGWLPSFAYVPPASLPRSNARIDDAASGAGRDPSLIRRVYNLMGLITDERGDDLQGPAGYWIEQITSFAELGMNGFIYWPSEDHEKQAAIFANEVVPSARESLGA